MIELQELWVWVAETDVGEDVIPARKATIHGLPHYVPLVAGCRDEAEDLRPHAERIAETADCVLKLVHFTTPVLIERLAPPTSRRPQ